MKAATLYKDLKEFLGPDLKPKQIGKGHAFFWKTIQVSPSSTRVLRIHEDASGSVTQIKLPVTSLRTEANTFLPLPASIDEVRAAIRREIDLLES